MSNPDLSHSPPNLSPDEERMVVLLENIRPRPTARFYRRMASAPWKSPSLETRFPRKVSLRLLTVGAIFLVLVVMVLFAFPSLNATARRLMYFFIPSPSQSLVLQVTPLAPGDPNVFGSPGYFSLTLPEAERLAGFQVRQLSISQVASLIPGLEFAGAHYDADLQAVTLRYSTDRGSLFLTQRKLGSIEEYNTIGPGAPVDQVTVRGRKGEYVTGGWKHIQSPVSETTASATAALQPGTQVNMDVTWDPTLAQHILRWQEGSFLFEILTSAGLGNEVVLGKGELVKIAESIR